MDLDESRRIEWLTRIKRWVGVLYRAGLNEYLPRTGRFFLLLLTLFVAPQFLSAQLEYVPIEQNTIVAQAASQEKMRIASRWNLRSSDRQVVVQMQRNKQRLVCFDNLLAIGQEIESVTNLTCAPLNHSAVSINDNCLMISTLNITGIQEDLYCVEICDTVGVCFTVQIIIEVRQPLGLPFMDDFSYTGPFPDRSKWLDRNVFVNNTMAKDPPSFGVATFDGLDENGSPYGGDEADISDYLTSGFFDLSGLTIQDNVYLTFYVQKKGLGLRPRVNDVFRLEFKNNQGNWIQIAEYPGISGSFPSTDSPPFEYKFILLTNAYLHDDFQFRFSNVGSRSGIREVWHLDYVRIGRNRNQNPAFEDVAFTTVPNSILFPYTAMPINHLMNNEERYINSEVSIGIYSHFSQSSLIDPSWHVLSDRVNGTEILKEGDLTLLELPPLVPVNQRNLSPGIHNFINPLRSDAWFDNFRSAIQGKDSVNFITTYTLNQDQEVINNIPETIRNNRVSSSTVIKDYFAYDDGTAEMGIALVSNPTVLTQIALKFHAEVADSLQGFQVHFPYVEGDQSNLLFNFKVWISELKDDKEDYRLIFQRPIYPDQIFDTLQAFSTYGLIDESTGRDTKLFIPPGDFYIGIQQVSTGARIPMGFDRNNPQGLDYIYFNRGFGWEKFSDQSNAIPGAVMLRPVFGNDPLPITTNMDELSKPLPSVKVFPNPTDGMINIQLSENSNTIGWYLDVVNTLGQRVYHSSFQNELNIRQLPGGVYNLSIRNERHQLISNHKILLR